MVWTATGRRMNPKLYAVLLVLALSMLFLCGGRAKISAAESVSTGRLVGEPPSEIAVDFAEPLDIVLVRLQVFDDNGRDHAISPPLVRDDRKRVSVKVDLLEPGAFTVEWGVVDSHGHLSKGFYGFQVKAWDTLTKSEDVPVGPG